MTGKDFKTILLIDSCSEEGFVALWSRGKQCFLKRQPADHTGAQQLALLLDEGLRQTGCAPDLIDLIAVAAGPGPYTALRVGVMLAKSMSYALQKPLIALSSLEVIEPCDGAFFALLDAKQGGVHAAACSCAGGRIDYEKGATRPWADFYQELAPKSRLRTPDAIKIEKRVRESVLESGEEKEIIVEKASPSAEQMAKRALFKANLKDFSDAFSLKAQYQLS